MSAPPLELFRRLTNGVYAVTAAHGGRSGAFTAAWVTQVAFDPLLIAVSVNPGHATWPLLQRSGRFVVNVLASDQLDVARQLGTESGREVNKLSLVKTVVEANGAVWLPEAAAWLECHVEREVSAGDHVVVIARVVNGDVSDPAATPLRYAETGNMDGSAALYPRSFTDPG